MLVTAPKGHLGEIAVSQEIKNFERDKIYNIKENWKDFEK